MRAKLLLGLLSHTSRILSKSVNGNNTALAIAIIGALGVILAAIIPSIISLVSKYKKPKRNKGKNDSTLVSDKVYQQRIRSYREAVAVDPRISTLQILD